MSDDLVKQLRDIGDHAAFEPHMHHLAADRIEELEAKVAAYKDQNNRLFRGLQESWPDDMRLSCGSDMEKAELTLEEITLETDEVGIWLLVGDKQAGHVSWYEITKRIQQQLLQEKFMLALAKLDEEGGLL